MTFWGRDCHYCGDEINGVGIDRVDSNIGYQMENIVPCCYQCNITKMDYSYNEFIELCVRQVKICIFIYYKFI